MRCRVPALGLAGLMVLIAVGVAPAVATAEPPEVAASGADDAGREEAALPVSVTSRAADRDALERIYRREGIAARAEKPGVLDYLSHAITRWWQGLTERMVLPQVASKPVLVLLASLVIASAVVVFGWLLVSLLSSRRRRNAPTAGGGGAIFEAQEEAARDAAAWRRVLAERLRAGDAEGALEALWWWLARSLSGAEADPSWTGRELLRHTDRLDLRPAVGRLDRLRYGPDPVVVGEVEALASRLEGQVP